MNSRTRAMGSALAIALACGWVQPAMAQSADNASVSEELAAMRAQMDAMAQRIETLQAELNQAQSNIDTVAQQAAATPAPAPAPEPAVEVEWKGAPKFIGKGGFTFKPRGRLNMDAGFINAPDSTGRNDGFGSEMRRARLGVEGDIPGGFGYKFEVDLAGNSVDITDANLTYEDGGATITVGQHNNFQSLEELSSSRYTSFIERAAFTDAFGFERRMGVSAQYGKGDVLVQGGLFSDNLGDLSNKNWSADGRAVFMPKLGKTQLHLGGSVHYTGLEDGSSVRYRQRPAVHFTSERFIDTKALSATSEFGLGLEAAAISGPFHVAAEGYWQKVNRPGALVDPTFFGGYVEAGYFLTAGDHRGYKKGVFDRAKPKNPVGKGGMGSWQINLRYDYLDLNDSGIIGGTQNGIQTSLVWAPTDYTRLLMTYSIMDYNDAVHPAAGGDTSYKVDSLGVRAQVDF